METGKKITVAIDGYSSCGKSTLAKALAKELHYVFIDSGSMYRGITLYALENKLIDNNTIKTAELITDLPFIDLSFGTMNESGIRPLLLNGRDVSKEIRSLLVSNWVSEIAAIKEVRVALVRQQRALGEKGGVIMDGRDIGTVVFPHAELKLFLTASADVRAQRRFDEMQAKGESGTLEEIKQNLAHRDHLDSTREESPLIQAPDAIVIDNSQLSEEDQLRRALNLVQQTVCASV